MCNKKNIFLILLLSSTFCNAQDIGEKSLYPYDYDNEVGAVKKHGDKKYINMGLFLSYVSPKNKSVIKNYNSASFTIGRTFYLSGFDYSSVRFGIDATLFELNYSDNKIKHITDTRQKTYNVSQMDFALQAGPSLLINPVGKIYVSCYSRLAPSYLVLKSNNNTQTKYVTFLVNGLSLSYGWIGLGIENRFSCNSYILYPNSTTNNLSLMSSEYIGWKSYITFKF